MFYRVRDAQGRIRMFTADLYEALDKFDFVRLVTGHGILESGQNPGAKAFVMYQG